MRADSGDWMAQAKRDLESAEWAMRGGYYEWACFMGQQAAEKGAQGGLCGAWRRGLGTLGAPYVARAPSGD